MPHLRIAGALAPVALLVMAAPASATLVSISPCVGANACTITDTPPETVTQNPNDGILLAWDEKQNVVLEEDLPVDRVFDSSADFVIESGGQLFLAAGTIVSSHYLQWDPGEGSDSLVEATIAADSQIFAFITDDDKLFGSDEILGLDDLDYSDFGLRGLEAGDTTEFNGEKVDIGWTASSPGDWTRLITAYSPTAAASAVPVPAAAPLLVGALGALGLVARRRRG